VFSDAYYAILIKSIVINLNTFLEQQAGQESFIGVSSCCLCISINEMVLGDISAMVGVEIG
jgi:hypothetical protein